MGEDTPESAIGEDSAALGFRDPADHVTHPCLVYMARVMELRSFIGFYFNFVKTSGRINELIATLEPKYAKSVKEEFEPVVYKFSRHRQLVNEIMLSRAVESFDLYVVSIVRDLFLAKPEMMKSEGTIDVSTVIESGTYEEIVYRIAERKLHELTYKSLGDLRKFVLGRSGVDLFKSEEIFDIALTSSEVRNLIAHNDCVVNKVFRTKTKDSRSLPDVSDTGKVNISDEWLRHACYALDGIVFDFDQAVIEKFQLQTLFRYGAFMYRG